MGFALRLAGHRLIGTTVLGTIYSGAVEFVQIFIPGRHPMLWDLAANASGTAAGWCMVAAYGWALSRPSRRAWARAAAAGLLPLSTLTHGLLQQLAPPEGQYFAQWAPEQGHLELWTGSVEHAAVAGLAVADGRSKISSTLRAALRDSTTVSVEGRAGGPSRDLAGIFAITTDTQEEVILLGVHGTDVIVRLRRRAADLRLDAPAIRFPNALAGVDSGAELSVTLALTPDASCVTVNDVRACTQRPSAGSSWRSGRALNLAPPRILQLTDAIYVFVLMFPVGLLAHKVGRVRAVLALPVLGGAWMCAALWSGLAAPTIVDWCAWILALASGLALRAAPRQET